MQKIIILCNDLKPGGTARDCVEWNNRFLECGTSTTIIEQIMQGEFHERLAPESKIINLQKTRAFHCLGPLAKVLKKSPDTPVLSNCLALMACCVILKTSGIIRNRLIYVDAFNPMESLRASKKNKLLYTIFIKRCDAIIHISEFATRACIKLGFDKGKVHFIPNIIKLPEAQPTPRNPAQVNPRLISVGRLDPIKGFDRLIRAFPEVISNFHGATLDIIGDGPDKSRLAALIKELNLENSVKLLGHQNKVTEKIKDYDAFVLPSYYEGMPNTLIEALSVGLRVACTPCMGGVQMMLERIGLKDCIISEKNFSAGLINAIKNCLASDNEYWSNAQKNFRTLFDDKKNFDHLSSICLKSSAKGPINAA